MRSFYEKLLDLMKTHPDLIVATVVKVTGSSPRDEGAKLVAGPKGLLEGTLGGGTLEAQVIQDAQECLKRRSPALKSYSLSEEGLGMKCGGSVQVYLEPVFAPCRLLVFGGGHVGRAIARLASMAGFGVCVIDDREERLERSGFPEGAALCLTDSAYSGGYAPPGPKDFAVVVTRDADLDAGLAGRFACACAYLGVLGSRTKMAFIRKTLAGQGVDESAIGRIRCPMGLDIGADTPEEIAVSVVAEMIAVRSARKRSLAKAP